MSGDRKILDDSRTDCSPVLDDVIVFSLPLTQARRGQVGPLGGPYCKVLSRRLFFEAAVSQKTGSEDWLFVMDGIRQQV